MDGVDNLNQPELPNEENDSPSFEAKDIRRSFVGTTRSLFSDAAAETKRSPKVAMLLVAIAGVLVITIITLIVLSNLSSRDSEQASSSTQPSETPISAEEANLRSAEKEKLSTVMALISQENWEYADALLETVSPKHLSDCSKLYYYRSVVNISAHFKSESLPVEAAKVNVEKLKDACLVTNE